ERDHADKLRKIPKIFIPQAPAYSKQLLSQGAQLFRAGFSIAACRRRRGNEAFELIDERRRMLEPLVGIEQSAGDKLPVNRASPSINRSRGAQSLRFIGKLDDRSDRRGR